MANQPINATVDKDNFGNNAFTDFAPLLTLFGDEVTKQFLATSIYFADTVLLGIAPLGIMTIIVSSIRVGGPRFLKTLVGRARDAPDDDEKEILSSTSRNVREIWNGNRVVRQTGGSKTTVLAFEEDLIETYGFDIQRQRQLPPLRRLNEPKRQGYSARKFDVLRDTKRSTLNPQGKINGDAEDSNLPPDLTLSDKIPPNLTLNIKGAIPDPTWTVSFICIGLVVQLAVMVVNALGVYYYHWPRAGKIVEAYGYPLWAAGTVVLSIGTIICGWVIESSCRKVTLRPQPEHSKWEDAKDAKDEPERIIFFQEPILEQNIPAYAIEPVRSRGNLQISRRRFPPAWEDDNFTEEERMQEKVKYKRDAKNREMYTTVGTVLTLLGFVCQNIGTRELHWSAGFLQLVAIFTLAFLRAGLRRKVGYSLDKSSKILELERKFEACDLAKHFTKSTCYLPILLGEYSPIFGSPPDISKLKDPPSHWPVKLRKHDFNAFEVKDTFSIPDYGALSSTLEIHSLIGDCETDAAETSKIATGCYQAMESILKLLFTRADDHLTKPICRLSFFAYMAVQRESKPAADGKQNVEKSALRGLIPVSFPANGLSDDHIRLIRAIINVTRYTYKDHVSRFTKDKQLSMRMGRIVGTCALKHVQAHAQLLSSWLEPSEVSVRYLQNDIQEERAESPKKYGWEEAYSVFGIPLSSSLHVRPSMDTDTPNTSNFCELVVVDDNIADVSEAIDRNIVQELITCFMLQVTRDFRLQITEFLGKGADKGCKKIVDVLLKHNVFKSDYDARLAVVPALIQSGALSTIPKAAG